MTDQPDRFTGGCGHPQPAARVGEHHPGRGSRQQPDAAVGEHVQEVDDVEILDHRVGQVDEGIREQFGVHRAHLLLRGGKVNGGRPVA
jgi:hypothetical protein